MSYKLLILPWNLWNFRDFLKTKTKSLWKHYLNCQMSLEFFKMSLGSFKIFLEPTKLKPSLEFSKEMFRIVFKTFSILPCNPWEQREVGSYRTDQQPKLMEHVQKITNYAEEIGYFARPNGSQIYLADRIRGNSACWIAKDIHGRGWIDLWTEGTTKSQNKKE